MLSAGTIKEGFDAGFIVVLETGDDTYTLSLVDVDGCGHEQYAFVSLDGHTWANGKAYNPKHLFEGDEEYIKVLDRYEYADFLKEGI